MWHWLIVHLSQETGTSDSNSRAYDFWSGFGSDIGEATIVGGIVAGLRHANCHQKGCWRIGHVIHGTTIRTCHKHHPLHPRAKRNGSVADMHEAQK